MDVKAEPVILSEPWRRDANGELLVGGQPLSRVVAAVGSTPCYVYDRARIDARVQGLRDGLPAGVLLHYAMKANPMPALVCHVARLVDGLDVASAGELRVALDSGMASEHISFAGPGKSEAELAQSVAAGILVNLESFREVGLLARAGERLGVRPRVAVRVNLPFELKASGMKMSGGARQFGVDSEQVPGLLREFRTYAEGRGRLRQFRSEAVRAGFADAWSRRDYATIVRVAERLPEAVLQEDQELLMYYDNASLRVD